jgi:hypothetical protein
MGSNAASGFGVGETSAASTSNFETEMSAGGVSAGSSKGYIYSSVTASEGSFLSFKSWSCYPRFIFGYSNASFSYFSYLIYSA